MADLKDRGNLNHEDLSPANSSKEISGDDVPVRTRREPPPLVAAWSSEERALQEKKLVRKIDLRLMPMVILMYIMNYLDRNNIASARLLGIEDEFHPTTTEWNTAISILFVGYILMQVPSNIFLNKIGKPAIYLPTAMVIWGVISTATAGAHSMGGIFAIRFFLGFIEAAYFPGCLYFLSSWYTRKELGFRTAILYSGSLISGAFSGLIAAGVLGGMDHALGLRAWRWLFIIEGAITIVIATAAYFVLPNLPRTTSWLSEEERQLAAWRLDEDIGEDDWVSSEDQSLGYGFVLAIKDVKTWVLAIILIGIVSSGSVTNFFPSVTKTLPAAGGGTISNTESLLLTAPPYVLAVITTYLNSWHADRTGERYWHITIPLWFAVIAFIIAASTSTFAARYVAMILMVPGIYSGYVVVLAWISNTLPRPPAKRAAALAFVNALSNATSIYASYMYIDPPGYRIPFIVNCLTAFMALCGATALRFILVRLNKKLERGEAVHGIGSGGSGVPGEAAQKGFRFLY